MVLGALVMHILCIIALGKGHLGHGLLPQAFVMPDWWSSKASSLSRHSGTGLVVSSSLGPPEWPHPRVMCLTPAPGPMVPGAVHLVSSLLLTLDVHVGF